MAGILLNVLPKNTYPVSSTALAASQTIAIPVAVNVDVSRYRDITLITRIHSFTGGSGAAVTVEVFNSAPTMEDPANVFRDGTALIGKTISWSATIAPSVSFGYMTPVNGSNAAAGFVDVILTIKQASSATNLSIAVSIDLALKS